MTRQPLSVVRFLRVLMALLLAAVATGCSVMDRSRSAAPLEAGARWVILPMANHTETPRQRGVQALARPPAGAGADLMGDLPDRRLQADSQRWAAEQGIRYALTGAVDEWRYKVGVDGEPAVGVVLQVIDLPSGDVVWTATGARSGWSREALSAVAQKLMRDLLGDLTLR